MCSEDPQGTDSASVVEGFIDEKRGRVVILMFSIIMLAAYKVVLDRKISKNVHGS